MLLEKIFTKNPTTDPVEGCPDLIAKVRYVDFQKRSHTVEVESDTADRKHLEDLVKARYPADKVYFQSVKQK